MSFSFPSETAFSFAGILNKSLKCQHLKLPETEFWEVAVQSGRVTGHFHEKAGRCQQIFWPGTDESGV
jgi:hypothetical protein